MVTGFFKKLTNKLFNSSSKFTKDLDEAVNEVSETEDEVDVKKIAHDEKIENDLGDSLMTKLIWKPQNFVEASNELVQTASKLMEALENDEDVQSVHSNLVFS